MGTKTITIMDDAYQLLARNKRGKESFSEVLRRVLTQKKSIMDFAGAWAVKEEEKKEMKKTLKEIDRGLKGERGRSYIG